MTNLATIQKALRSKHEETRREALQGLKGRPIRETRDLLFSTMGDESWRVRKEAVNVFVAAEPDEDSIDALLELLRNQDNAGLRNSAAEAAVRIGYRAATSLIRLSCDEDEDVRKYVIDVMGVIGSTEFVPALLSSLNDQDVNVAAAAAEHLGDIGDSSAVPDLISAIIANDSVLFRFSALAALGKLTSHEPVPAEIIKLVDQDILCKGVYDCLGSIGDESTQPILLQGILSRQKSSRSAAIKSLYRIYQRSNAVERARLEESLRHMSGTDMVTALMDAFDANEPVLAEAITVFLGIIGDLRSAATLLSAFASERLSIIALSSLKRFGISGMHALITLYPDVAESARAAICKVLGELSYRAGSALISEALHDPSPQVRLAAVTAAGKLGLTGCIRDIVQLLDDGDFEIRNGVIVCLQMLALIDRNVIQEVAYQLEGSARPEQRRDAAILHATLGDGERLALMVKDENADVRQAAVASIGKLHLSMARSTLLIALVDESPDVRIAAAVALAEIGGTEVLAPLTHALNDNDNWVQCAALRSIAKIAPDKTLAAVQHVFQQADGLLMLTCLELLKTLGTPEALLLVKDALQHPDDEVTRLAISVLMRAGELKGGQCYDYWAGLLADIRSQRVRLLISETLKQEKEYPSKAEIQNLLDEVA